MPTVRSIPLIIGDASSGPRLKRNGRESGWEKVGVYNQHEYTGIIQAGGISINKRFLVDGLSLQPVFKALIITIFVDVF